MSPDRRGREAYGPPLAAFRPVPRTGVIFVTEEARARGFRTGAEGWCNLGQGQPESGPLDGAPPRLAELAIDPGDHEYAPVAGLWELREAVAGFYNEVFRRGMRSRYAAENVAVSGGGRASLTRAVASLGHVNLGHFLPDYTAYEELLEIFRLFSPIPILLDREAGYRFTARDLEREVLGRGLGAVLLSNPCNPTGRTVAGDQLADWVGLARRLDCALLVDEFYSHFLWLDEGVEPDTMLSAARYVEDVDRDPVVLFDGFTKSWRYPGWRVTWTVGPRAVIEAVTSAGSFLDGGGSKPLQRAAVPLLDPAHVRAETEAIRRCFLPKREAMLAAARRAGLGIDLEPQGTFYLWVSLGELPEPLRDCMELFRAALRRQVITVPGVFFDVNPGQRRARRLSRFRNHLRLSFGPPITEVEEGMRRLAELVEEHRAGET